MHPKYDEDIYGWTVNTARLLKEGRLSEIDVDNVIEEIEALGRSEKRQLGNNLSLVIAHLLKCQFQPTMKGHSWIYTNKEQRLQAKMILRDSPSLKSNISDILERAYNVATSKAAKDTGLDANVFPENCPYSFDQIMDEKFYPE